MKIWTHCVCACCALSVASIGRHALLILAVFALDMPASASWKEKVLYSFQGGSDGYSPAGGVVFDKSGNLYGANTWGGDRNCLGDGCGTVFQVSPPNQKGGAWTEAVIHAFHGINGQGDGRNPLGGVTVDARGNLYGTTSTGGDGPCLLLGTHVGCGAIYELSPPAQQGGQWTYAILYSFQGGKDGNVPAGELVFDGQGNLYGATWYGGGKGDSCNAFYGGNCGTVFKLRPPKVKGGTWTEEVLYSFPGGIAGQPKGDGGQPNGGLVLDSKGALYGTTYYGGNEAGICNGGSAGLGCGTVFKISPPSKQGGAWIEKVLHRFDGQDGANPAGGVIFNVDANLYGTTSAGLPRGDGLVFQLKKPSGKSRSWTESVLHIFTERNDGTSPMAGLMFDSIGNLYGASLGGQNPGGVIFCLKRPKNGGTWPFKVLCNFLGAPDGDHPIAGLVFDGRGNLYSTTEFGGTGQSCQEGGCGTVFKVSP